MKYEDFDLLVEPVAGRDYRVSVLRSPGGEGKVEVRFPYDEIALKNRLLTLENALLRSGGRRRRVPTAREKEVLDFGQILFDTLFSGDVRTCYDVSWDRVRHEGKGLRIKLRLDTPALAALPWEFLHDPRRAEYLVLSNYTPLVRYFELAQSLQAMPVAPPLRILGMIASPVDLPELDIAVEKQRVENATADLRAAGLVDLVWLEGQSWRELQKAMRRGPWHIFHFIGHGMFDARADEGSVIFANRSGRSQRMSATSLALMLGDHAALRLVFLNSCEGGHGGQDVFSSTASILVRRGVPCVLAMQYEITDAAAVEFSRTFYEAIADGMSLESAVTEARKAITFAVNNSLEWGTPVFFSHAPDGVLFELGGEKAPEKPAPEIVKGASPLEMEWCWVPGGPFSMGSDEIDSEKPVHEVQMEGFWMARHPVTNAQYRFFVRAGGYKERCWWSDAGRQWRDKERITQPSYWEDSKWNGAAQPVVGVSWYEAEAFCRWAAETTGEPIRLPGEAEWEKAARGPDKRKYPWGNNKPTKKLCNFSRNIGKTTPVGRYSPGGDSPYGCTDMAGNVWEWCASQYREYPYLDDDGRNDRSGTVSRVVRGGSWYGYAFIVRTSHRLRSVPSYRYILVGFRCASTPF